MRSTTPGRPSLPLTGLALGLALGLLGCSSDDERAPAASATAPQPAGTAPAPTGAEAAAADRQAREAGQGLCVGSLRRTVGPREATGGWSLWFFRTARGRPAHMILRPDGRAAGWSGCRPAFSVVDRCGAAAAAPSTFVLAGRATPAVASVVVVTRSGARRPAVLGDVAWLYRTDALPAVEEGSPEEPRWIEARDRSGAVLRRIGIDP